MTTREAHLVELVSAEGEPVGSATVEAAHTDPGRLHRAFSVLLVDNRGRLLLQQRAAVKTRFALRWANSCCGHPSPGEPVAEAAGRRLREELGVAGAELRDIGVFVYRAQDTATGRVEHEYDHVLLAEVDEALPVRPDPAEVSRVDWVHPVQLSADLAARPGDFAPWLAGVLGVWQAVPDRA